MESNYSIGWFQWFFHSSTTCYLTKNPFKKRIWHSTPQYLSIPEAITEMSTVLSDDVLPRKGRRNLAEASLISAQKCPRSDECLLQPPPAH